MSIYEILKNWWINSPKPNSKYGWKKEPYDARDYLMFPQYSNGGSVVVEIMPESVDLRPLMPDVYNQLSEGSCTANGICGLIQFMSMKQKLLDTRPRSRNFLYYNERDMEGTVNSDAGAIIRDGIKSVNTLGVCFEDTWPYIPSQFTWKPNDSAYVEAKQHPALVYKKIIQRGELMRLCLSQGIPFTFGFTVYESFESQQTSQTGLMTMPGPQEKILGGHCVDVAGYTTIGKFVPGIRHYICRNSWGKDWGDNGYFYMPEPFITNPNYCSDFWAIELVK